ncbi:hypothetical protein GF358_00110 [Candidatus Woesearchaeota archaeon]|nr:hypothetical protein [Candidatus Woesearchaeota archaeon]
MNLKDLYKQIDPDARNRIIEDYINENPAESKAEAMQKEEERHQRESILEAILVSSITETETTVTTRKDKILKILAMATVEYLQGDTHAIARHNLGANYIASIFLDLRAQLQEHPDKISRRISQALLKLTEPEQIDPRGPDRPYDTCEVYEFLGPHYMNLLPRITSELEITYRMVINAKKTIADLTTQEKKDVSDIGKIMRAHF